MVYTIMNCSSIASGIASHQVIPKAEEDKLKMWRTSEEFYLSLDVLNKLIRQQNGKNLHILQVNNF